MREYRSEKSEERKTESHANADADVVAEQRWQRRRRWRRNKKYPFCIDSDWGAPCTAVRHFYASIRFIEQRTVNTVQLAYTGHTQKQWWQRVACPCHCVNVNVYELDWSFFSLTHPFPSPPPLHLIPPRTINVGNMYLFIYILFLSFTFVIGSELCEWVSVCPIHVFEHSGEEEREEEEEEVQVKKKK